MHQRQPDTFHHQPVQKMRQITQHVLQVQLFRLQRLLARKGQQLPDQSRGPIGVLPDLFKIGIFGILGVMAQQQKITMPGNRGQQVVEIMRNTARKLADRLHLLALHELRFQRLQPGGIVQHRQRTDPPAIDKAAQGHLQIHIVPGAPGVQDFGPAGMSARHHIGQPVRHRTPQPFEDVVKHRRPDFALPHQITCGAVGDPQHPVRPEDHQRDGHFLQVRADSRVARTRHRLGHRRARFGCSGRRELVDPPEIAILGSQMHRQPQDAAMHRHILRSMTIRRRQPLQPEQHLARGQHLLSQRRDQRQGVRAIARLGRSIAQQKLALCVGKKAGRHILGHQAEGLPTLAPGSGALCKGDAARHQPRPADSQRENHAERPCAQDTKAPQARKNSRQCQKASGLAQRPAIRVQQAHQRLHSHSPGLDAGTSRPSTKKR